jgi:hypothetical protein
MADIQSPRLRFLFFYRFSGSALRDVRICGPRKGGMEYT